MDPLPIDEHTMRVWGGWATFAFGTLMLVRAYFDYRRTKNASAIRVGFAIFAVGLFLLLVAIFRL